jgi:hypothetical protein
MKGLRFTVPLLRIVVPLDHLQSHPAANAKGNNHSAPMHNPTILRPQMLLRIIRIETPLVAVLPKPKVSLEAPLSRPTETAPMKASKKKINPMRKSSGGRGRPPSSRRKKK